MLPSGRDTCKCPSFAEEDASREDDVFLDLTGADDDDDGARKAVLTDDRHRHASTRRLACSIIQRPSFTLNTKPNITSLMTLGLESSTKIEVTTLPDCRVAQRVDERFHFEGAKKRR